MSNPRTEGWKTNVRKGAAWALEQIGSKLSDTEIDEIGAVDAVLALIQALKDQNKYVREYVDLPNQHVPTFLRSITHQPSVLPKKKVLLLASNRTCSG